MRMVRISRHQSRHIFESRFLLLLFLFFFTFNGFKNEREDFSKGRESLAGLHDNGTRHLLASLVERNG